MKQLLLLFFTGIIFSNTTNLAAQENESYLNVIAKSLPEQYIQSTNNLFFTIQVGAFRNENTTLETLENIIIIEENQITKYRLGEFSSYDEATEYKKMLLSVCKDAFIVSIKNGKRIHIKEALNNAAVL